MRVAHLQTAEVKPALGLAVFERKQKLRFLQSIDDGALGATVEGANLFEGRL